MLTIAMFLTGLWLVLASQGEASKTLTLIFGIVVLACALFELVPVARDRLR